MNRINVFCKISNKKFYNKWYKEGLHFSCTQCGKCCTHEGICKISKKEAKTISEFLDITLDEFTEHYTSHQRFDNQEFILKDHPKTTRCIFLSDKNKCTIYEARPKQCRTYPFWDSTVATSEAWKAEKSDCEGIQLDLPPNFTQEQIEERVKQDLKEIPTKSFLSGLKKKK